MVFAALVAICLGVAIYASPESPAIIAPSELLIEGESTNDVLRVSSEAASHLTIEQRRRFTDIRFEYIGSYGVDRACDLMRGKTVQQVFDDYEPTGVDPVAEGVDDYGVEWSLYAAPKKDVTSDETEPL